MYGFSETPRDLGEILRWPTGEIVVRPVFLLHARVRDIKNLILVRYYARARLGF